MTAEIPLKDEFWRIERMNRQDVHAWIIEKNPTWIIENIVLVNNPIFAFPTIAVKYELKTEDQLFRERFESLLERTPKFLSAPKKEKKHKCGECPECGQNVKGWEPMFGGLAPEWWATMREHGIDPATGHLSECGNKSYKY